MSFRRPIGRYCFFLYSDKHIILGKGKIYLTSRLRITSTYFFQRVVPMFSEQAKKGICFLGLLLVRGCMLHSVAKKIMWCLIWLGMRADILLLWLRAGLAILLPWLTGYFSVCLRPCSLNYTFALSTSAMLQQSKLNYHFQLVWLI